MISAFLVLMAMRTASRGMSPEFEVVRQMSYRDRDESVPLRRIKGTTAVFYQSKMSCDVDGAPNAYHPDDDGLALDLIASAGGKRKDDKSAGPLETQPSRDVVAYLNDVPFIQPDGEFKGFYVSKTSFEDKTRAEIDPTRYLDPRFIQYIVLPGGKVPEATLGDLAAVYDPVAKTVAFAVFGDVGPNSECGEASMATLKRLGMEVTDGKSCPSEGRHDLLYIVFPGSYQKLLAAEGWPHPQSTIDRLGKAEFDAWGGLPMVEQVLAVQGIRK